MIVVTPRKIVRELYERLYDVIIENAYVVYYTYGNKSLPSIRQMQEERTNIIREILIMCNHDEDIKNYVMHKISQDTHGIYEHKTAGALIRRYYFDDFICGIVGGISENKYSII